MLKIRCVACGEMIPTGFDLDYEGFKQLTFTNRKIVCPACKGTQTWNMDDVDVSIFKSAQE